MDVTGFETPTSLPILLGRGARRRCGVCNEGHLFDGWFTMKERCGRCGLGLYREYGSALGGMVINTMFCYAVLFVTRLAWVVKVGLDLPVLPALASIGGATTLAALVGYPFSKTIWLALTLRLDPPTPDEFDTTPGASGSGVRYV